MFGWKGNVTINPAFPTHRVRYLGWSYAQLASGTGCTNGPVKRILNEIRVDEQKLERLIVSVTKRGLDVEFMDGLNSNEIFKFDIRYISYCSVNAELGPRIFSWLYKRPKTELVCHAVLCSSKLEARTIAVALYDAFHVAYEEWRSKAHPVVLVNGERMSLTRASSTASSSVEPAASTGTASPPQPGNAKSVNNGITPSQPGTSRTASTGTPPPQPGSSGTESTETPPPQPGTSETTSIGTPPKRQGPPGTASTEIPPPEADAEGTGATDTPDESPWIHDHLTMQGRKEYISGKTCPKHGWTNPIPLTDEESHGWDMYVVRVQVEPIPWAMVNAMTEDQSQVLGEGPRIGHVLSQAPHTEPALRHTLVSENAQCNGSQSDLATSHNPQSELVLNQGQEPEHDLRQEQQSELVLNQGLESEHELRHEPQSELVLNQELESEHELRHAPQSELVRRPQQSSIIKFKRKPTKSPVQHVQYVIEEMTKSDSYNENSHAPQYLTSEPLNDKVLLLNGSLKKDDTVLDTSEIKCEQKDTKQTEELKSSDDKDMMNNGSVDKIDIVTSEMECKQKDKQTKELEDKENLSHIIQEANLTENQLPAVWKPNSAETAYKLEVKHELEHITSSLHDVTIVKGERENLHKAENGTEQLFSDEYIDIRF